MTSERPDHLTSTKRDWIIRFSVAALTSLMATVVGPFTTYEMLTFMQRLLYWGGLILVLLLPAVWLRDLLLPRFTFVPFWRDIAIAAVQGILLGPVVWAINRYVMEFRVGTTVALAEHIFIVFMIFLIPVAVRMYLRDVARAPAAVEVAPPEVELLNHPFLLRMDPEKRGLPIMVSADGHLLSVWTEHGESRIRMRFGDALTELEAFDGICIHRSHWVAAGKIDRIEVEGRRHQAILSCGRRLPVSKTGAMALREAGFELA